MYTIVISTHLGPLAINWGVAAIFDMLYNVLAMVGEKMMITLILL